MCSTVVYIVRIMKNKPKKITKNTFTKCIIKHAKDIAIR